VADKTAVCLNSLRITSVQPQSPEHPPLGGSSQYSMIREMHPAEKINTRGERLYENFVRMEREA
jgi:hypothetical protein